MAVSIAVNVGVDVLLLSWLLFIIAVVLIVDIVVVVVGCII